MCRVCARVCECARMWACVCWLYTAGGHPRARRGRELEGAVGELHVRADGPDDGRLFSGGPCLVEPYQKANPFSNKKKTNTVDISLVQHFFYIYI
jgi:hypothetical protein